MLLCQKTLVSRLATSFLSLTAAFTYSYISIMQSLITFQSTAGSHEIQTVDIYFSIKIKYYTNLPPSACIAKIFSCVTPY